MEINHDHELATLSQVEKGQSLTIIPFLLNVSVVSTDIRDKEVRLYLPFFQK